MVLLSSCVPRDYPDCVLAFADQGCKFYDLKEVASNSYSIIEAISESFEIACNNGLIDNCG